jgi:hypothetical protein
MSSKIDDAGSGSHPPRLRVFSRVVTCMTCHAASAYGGHTQLDNLIITLYGFNPIGYTSVMVFITVHDMHIIHDDS